ncbi:MAG TPA: hypothetical protein VNH83_29295 [Bryobacteraceae bacterium]|nr:hypothetical protein [Bryobacteraceae bacterium]
MPSTEDQLVGPIIAERRLSARISDSEVEEVVIRMAAPEREEAGDYRCSYEILAPWYRKVRYAAGIDGFQAIHLATKMIGVTLWVIAQEHGYHLTWEGLEDIGFPGFHA